MAVLFDIVGIGFMLYGGYNVFFATTILQQIAGLLCFLITAVYFTGAAILAYLEGSQKKREAARLNEQKQTLQTNVVALQKKVAEDAERLNKQMQANVKQAEENEARNQSEKRDDKAVGKNFKQPTSQATVEAELAVRIKTESDIELLKIIQKITPVKKASDEEAARKEWEKRNLPLETIEKLKDQLARQAKEEEDKDDTRYQPK